jgi:hypothetical protein
MVEGRLKRTVRVTINEIIKRKVRSDNRGEYEKSNGRGNRRE